MIRNKAGSEAILAAIYFSLQDLAQGKVLNQRIMDLATAAAKRYQAKLYMLSCWNLYAQGRLRSSSFLKVSDSRIEDILVGELRENRLRQRDLAECFSLDEEQLVLLKGSPDELTPQFMQEKQTHTVVMGTLGHTGILGLVIGNTAKTVLRSIDSGVVAVKPDNFVSPVQMLP